MSPKIISLACFLYVIGLLVGWASTGSNTFVDTNMTDPIQGLMSFQTSQETQQWGVLSIPMALPTYFNNMWKVATLDFPIFNEGWWIIIRWILLGPIIAMIVYGLVSTFMSLLQRTI